MAASQFLRDQLRSYSESWQRDHAQALACAELQERIKVAMTLHDLIATMDKTKWDAIKAQVPQPRAERAAHMREMHSLYSDWFKPCRELLDSLDAVEGQGYHIDDAGQFREACQYLEAMLRIDPDRLAKSLDDRDDGKFIPLSEVRDELRRLARA